MLTAALLMTASCSEGQIQTTWSTAASFITTTLAAIRSTATARARRGGTLCAATRRSGRTANGSSRRGSFRRMIQSLHSLTWNSTRRTTPSVQPHTTPLAPALGTRRECARGRLSVAATPRPRPLLATARGWLPFCYADVRCGSTLTL